MRGNPTQWGLVGEPTIVQKHGMERNWPAPMGTVAANDLQGSFLPTCVWLTSKSFSLPGRAWNILLGMGHTGKDTGRG